MKTQVIVSPSSNGVKLTPAQSMVIRLSVESFDADLTSEGLFDD